MTESRSGGTRVGRGPVSARAGRTRFRDDGADGAIEVGARRSSMRRVTFQAGEMSFFPRHTERWVGAKYNYRIPRGNVDACRHWPGLAGLSSRAIPGTCISRSVSGACGIERCSPQSVPFPPRPPQKVALPCSACSRVLRHSPASPVRSRPPFGSWSSRTGLDRLTKTCRRSTGSRACCFSACAGS